MKIKLNSSIDILLWEKEDGLEEFQPNMALRHLFGFQYGDESKKTQATVFAGVKNPLVAEWREATELNQAEAAAKQAAQASDETPAVTAEVVTEEPQSDS